MAQEIKLYVKAFQNDWRGLQWEEDRYVVSENEINMYDQSFDLDTAKNVLRFGLNYLVNVQSGARL